MSILFDRYLDKKEKELGHRSSTQWARAIFCIVLYVAVLAVQASNTFPPYIHGVLSQFQAIIPIYLAISFVGVGYWIGLSLNIFNIIAIVSLFLLMRNTNALTGVIVSLFTLVSITIINFLVQRNSRQFTEVMQQKEELLLLNEEIVASDEELRERNEQLLKYYDVIKSNEEKLNHLAFFDTLTELPNRKMILDRLELLVNLSRKNASSFAIVFIDLDDFKKINDTVGHHIGDLLIVSVASRLNRLVHRGDILGRIGGDEFALIIQQELKDEAILKYVEDLKSCLDENFPVERYEFFVKASFGISIYPQDGKTPDELIKCADTAMYKVKETGKNGIHFFRKEMREEILRKLDFETKMMAALQKDEFFLAFQPQFMANTSTLRGFEALIRWQSPDFGLLSPMKFIPIAEETGFIIQLGQWILRTACCHFKEMMDRYHLAEVTLSVNISAIQLDDLNFIPTLKNTLEESGLPAKNLELEITESVLIKSVDQTIRLLDHIKEMGVRIALDDFGAGYSSLRYLQILPIDTLKIDKSFVDHINDANQNKQIIGSIISLVHQMNIFVVAEGVETESQLNYLRKETCDGVQGFFFEKPLALPELLRYLDTAPSPR